MIIDVPTGTEFRRAGLGFMNLAADQVFTLYQQIDDAGYIDDGVTDEFWQAAQRPLASALALVQQGVEFLLKGQIADLSPFLLIASPASDWPAKHLQRDVAFAEFRTADAQDLPRIHDTACPKRLSDEFKNRYQGLRSTRNTIMHTVDEELHILADEVILHILEYLHELVGPQKWIDVRREYLSYTPATAA